MSIVQRGAESASWRLFLLEAVHLGMLSRDSASTGWQMLPNGHSPGNGKRLLNLRLQEPPWLIASGKEAMEISHKKGCLSLFPIVSRDSSNRCNLRVGGVPVNPVRAAELHAALSPISRRRAIDPVATSWMLWVSTRIHSRDPPARDRAIRL
jgi:hypothetical protein